MRKHFMHYKKTQRGFALLNILLGVSLLSGIIFLIMHAMSNYHAEESSRSIGEQMSPVISALLKVEGLATKTDGIYSLIANSSYCANNSSTSLLINIIPNGYLQSLQGSGFNFCATNNVKICSAINTETGACS